MGLALAVGTEMKLVIKAAMGLSLGAVADTSRPPHSLRPSLSPSGGAEQGAPRWTL